MLRLKIDKPCNINLFQSRSLPANSSLWDGPTLISCWGNATLGSLEVFPGFCSIRPLREDISQMGMERPNEGAASSPILCGTLHYLQHSPSAGRQDEAGRQQGCSGRGFGKEKGPGNESQSRGGTWSVATQTGLGRGFCSTHKLCGSEGAVRSCHPTWLPSSDEHLCILSKAQT